MKYPQEVLPRPLYKRISTDLLDYTICRKVANKALLENSEEIVQEDLLGMDKPSDVFDYSTNLPGVFKLDHNRIEFIGENVRYFREYWEIASDVNEPVFQTDFIINEDIGWFFLPINKIHKKIQIPFNRKNTVPLETATAFILHTPTNSNFWHFSIRWMDGNGTEISRTDSKWKVPIIAAARAMISELITMDFSFTDIDEQLYIKSA